MRSEQRAVTIAIADAWPRPVIGGWTSYCQLVASLSAHQIHSREKQSGTDHASTR